ncbi:MAG TPA: phosphoglycerate mutase family protein [Candidatus Acidoferrales bacterium]
MRRYAKAAGLIFGVLFIIVILAAQQASSSLTTIIIVRHAERGPDQGVNTPITEKGRERAAELARVLKDAGIQRIIVSEYIRTRQTVEPLATALGIEPEAVPVARNVDALAARLGELKGETVLVISHHGRIEPLVEKLGGGKVTLTDASYDNIFILTLPASGPPRLVTVKYGAR